MVHGVHNVGALLTPCHVQTLRELTSKGATIVLEAFKLPWLIVMP